MKVLHSTPQRTWTAPSAPNQPLVVGGLTNNYNPSTTSTEIRDDAIKSMETKMELLSTEIAEKQILFQKYLAEADERMQELQTCGIEIVNLRLKVKDLEERNSGLKRTLDDFRKNESQLIEQCQKDSKLEQMSEMELRGMLKKCISAFNLEKKKRKELEEKLKELDDKKEVERQFKKVLIAHQAQAAVVLKLQDENKKLDKFKSTIKNQELVIQKLESLLGTYLIF